MIPTTQPGVSDGDVRAFGSDIDLTCARFSRGNARELVLYAKMAYDEPPTIECKETDTQILIRDLGDCVVVAPRGTSSLHDFITDAKAWRTKTPIGEVHAGTWEAWSSVSDQVEDALPRNKPIVFGAHSLGGMIATVAAKALRDRLFKIHSVYTFGCPRTGNAHFQRVYNATAMPGSSFATLGAATFDIINNCDLFPRVPGYASGYRRPGRDEFISSNRRISEDPSVPFRLFSDIESIAAHWMVRHNWTAVDGILTDHHVDNYIADLEAAS